jgi:hypothetical protein
MVRLSRLPRLGTTMTWLEFQIELAIRLSLEVYKEKNYVAWANKWLSGEDRTYASATATDATYAAAYAYASADAAYAAAYAATYAATSASATAAATASSAIRLSIAAGAKLESVVRFL